MQPATANMVGLSQNCVVIKIPANDKGEGDGSGVKPKYILVCKEINKTR